MACDTCATAAHDLMKLEAAKRQAAYEASRREWRESHPLRADTGPWRRT